MTTFGYCLFGVALLVVAINLNYSLLSLVIYRLREQHWPSRPSLGIPLLGTVATLAAYSQVPAGHAAGSVLLLLLLLDSGGPLAWLLAAWLRRRERRPQASTHAAATATTTLRRRPL